MKNNNIAVIRGHMHSKTSHPSLILATIIRDDAAFHSTTHLFISSLTNRATPYLPLPLSTPETLPITLTNTVLL
ncbi:hypothetical protein SK128_022076 [Halocaridina rubra]|uniref:Uncharacterized protein n=1 Tax=Halocaridina rubra TaxID=373956 RepID=A0AAN8X2H2_HALRR